MVYGFELDFDFSCLIWTAVILIFKKCLYFVAEIDHDLKINACDVGTMVEQ